MSSFVLMFREIELPSIILQAALFDAEIRIMFVHFISAPNRK